MRNIASFSLLLIIIVGALFIWNSKAVAPQKDLPVSTISPTITGVTIMPSAVASPSSVVSMPPSNNEYTCPTSEYVDCMPTIGNPSRPQCEEEFLQWAQKNCPNFKGAAL